MRSDTVQRAIDIAWAAGLIEGEGSIGISQSSTRPDNLPSYMLRISVAMTDEQCIAEITHILGGSYRPKKSGAAHWKPQWSWVQTARKAQAALIDIQPYVRSDRVSAKVALGLEFQAQKAHGGRWATDGYMHRQREFHERMRLLNVRGR